MSNPDKTNGILEWENESCSDFISNNCKRSAFLNTMYERKVLVGCQFLFDKDTRTDKLSAWIKRKEKQISMLSLIPERVPWRKGRDCYFRCFTSWQSFGWVRNKSLESVSGPWPTDFVIWNMVLILVNCNIYAPVISLVILCFGYHPLLSVLWSCKCIQHNEWQEVQIKKT